MRQKVGLKAGKNQTGVLQSQLEISSDPAMEKLDESACGGILVTSQFTSDVDGCDAITNNINGF